MKRKNAKNTKSSKVSFAKTLLIAEDLLDQTSQRSTKLRTATRTLGQQIGAQPHVLYVDPNGPFPESGFDFLDQGQLTQAIEKLKQENIPATTTPGYPADAILQIANNKKAGPKMLALGTHARTGIKRMLLGSVAEEVVRNSNIPVLLVSDNVKRLPNAKEAQPIIVGTDLGPNSRAAEVFALELAEKSKLPVMLYYNLFEGLNPVYKTALSSPSNAERLKDVIEKEKDLRRKQIEARLKPFLKKKINATAFFHTELMPASDGLVQLAEKQGSYLIIGTHGRDLISQAFLGSTARDVIVRSAIPVITIRPRAI